MAAVEAEVSEVGVTGSYVPQDFEAAWQQRWEEEGLYRTREDPDKPKFYALDFFPYPSGDGLSVGHCRNYIPTDTYSRFMRMRGYTVLHPMGWDAFGEPTENKAIEVRESPRALTDRYTANYKRQMRLVGISFDWDREIDSSLPTTTAGPNGSFSCSTSVASPIAIPTGSGGAPSARPPCPTRKSRPATMVSCSAGATTPG